MTCVMFVDKWICVASVGTNNTTIASTIHHTLLVEKRLTAAALVCYQKETEKGRGRQKERGRTRTSLVLRRRSSSDIQQQNLNGFSVLTSSGRIFFGIN